MIIRIRIPLTELERIFNADFLIQFYISIFEYKELKRKQNYLFFQLEEQSKI